MKKTKIEQGLDRLRPIIQAAAQKRLAEGREVEPAPPRVEPKLTSKELTRRAMRKTEIEQGLDRLRLVVQAAAQKRLAEGRDVKPTQRVEPKLTREELTRRAELGRRLMSGL